MADDPTGEFEMVDEGRHGYVVYREGRRKLKLYWEASGVPKHDIIFARLGLRSWDEPEGEAIPRAVQFEILNRLRAWTETQGIRTDINLPAEVELDEVPYMWAGCDEPRMKGFAICRRHYDEGLISQ